MFKLLKFLITLAVVIGAVYFTFFISLGDRTLWDHLVGISNTSEAKELGDQLEKKAEIIKNEVIEKIPDKSGNKPPVSEGKSNGKSDDVRAPKEPAKGDKKTSAAPLSNLSQDDRDALIRLLQEKQDRQ